MLKSYGVVAFRILVSAPDPLGLIGLLNLVGVGPNGFMFKPPAFVIFFPFFGLFSNHLFFVNSPTQGSRYSSTRIPLLVHSPIQDCDILAFLDGVNC